MKHRVASLGGLCVVLVGSLACDVQEVEPRAVEIDEIEAVLSVELCERIESCRCEQGKRYPDVETCAQDARMLAEQLEATPGLFPTTALTYDPTCLGAVVDAYVGLGCAVELASADEEDEDACTPPCHYYYGTRLVGQSCEITGTGVSDCAQGLRCVQEECMNPCAEEPPPTGAKEGDACFVGDCMEGLYCELASETCRALPVAGQPCYEGQCADELVCDREADLCQALPLVGEPCLQGSRCAEGLFCETDFDDPNGEPQCYAPQALAAPCRGHSQCDSGYCPAGFCESAPAEGEACEAGVCGEGLSCHESVCVLADAAICWAEVPGA